MTQGEHPSETTMEMDNNKSLISSKRQLINCRVYYYQLLSHCRTSILIATTSGLRPGFDWSQREENGGIINHSFSSYLQKKPMAIQDESQQKDDCHIQYHSQVGYPFRSIHVCIVIQIHADICGCEGIDDVEENRVSAD